MGKQELAILYSGSIDSLALYTLSAVGKHPEIPQPRMIHLLCIQNGASRFLDFPYKRFKIAETLLKAQMPPTDPMPEGKFVELDTTRLFQELWLKRCEELMSQFNGKNLVCTACSLAMHARAVIYCVERLVPLFISSSSSGRSCCPKNTEAFMTKAMAFSSDFGITSRFPVHPDFDDERVVKHVLEDHGLPSNSGGERTCLFSQTVTSATDEEIASYLDAMIPRVIQYVESRLDGRIKDVTTAFTPDNSN